MIIFDTDIFSLWTYDNMGIISKMIASPSEEVLSITIITHMEVLRGRFDSIVKSASHTELTTAVDRFRVSEAALAGFDLLYPNEAAADHFGQLLKQKRLAMKRHDMLIACIALAHDALLVTRNLKDFQRVKGLRLEDWSA